MAAAMHGPVDPTRASSVESRERLLALVRGYRSTPGALAAKQATSTIPKVLGLTIPPSLLQRADQVIE